MLNKDQKELTMRTNESKNIVPLPSRSHSLLLCFLAGVGLLFFSNNAFAMQASYYSRAALIRDGQDKITHFIMANGKEFQDDALTCAAGKQYKLNTYLRIRNNENGKEVVVKVTDRINKRFYQTRIDLSKKAFETISGKQGFKQGLLQVSVEEIK